MKQKQTKRNRASAALRFLFFFLFAGFFVWFFLPVPLYGILNIGNLTGMVLCAAGCAAALFFPKIRALLSRLWKKKAGKRLLRLVAAVLAAGALLVMVFSVNMLRAAHVPPTDAETVLVLGCKVRGTAPSLMLSRRIAAAKSYLDAHPEAAAVLSGGQGDDESISEAECMYRELVAAGIDPVRLYVEDRSASTKENMVFSMEIIRENGLPEEIAVVTDGFHQYRARLLLKPYTGRISAIRAKTPVVMLPTYIVREYYGILYAFLFAKG